MFCLAAVCCVCLSHVKKNSNIICKNNNEQFKKKIQFCFPDTVNKEFSDELQNICSVCNEHLETCYEFKRLYLNSQTKLKQYLSYLSQDSHSIHENLSSVLQNICTQNYGYKNDRRIDEFQCTQQMTVKNEIVCDDLLLKMERDDSTELFNNEVADMPFEYFESKQEIVDNDFQDIKVYEQVREDIDKNHSNECENTFMDKHAQTKQNCNFNKLHHGVLFEKTKGTQIVPKMFNNEERFFSDTLNEHHVKNITKKKVKSFEFSGKNEREKFVDSSHVGIQSGESVVKQENNADSCEYNLSQGCLNASDFSKDNEIFNINNDETSEQNNFKNKKKIIHIDEKRHSCDVCNYQFITSSNLSVHKIIHTGERPYSCDICNYQGTTASNLKIHKRIHTGEKPYFCDVCGYQFTTSSKLKSHKRIHTDEKPYSCDMCSYECKESGNLKRHKRIHSGIKRFSCDICNYKCNESSSLKRHKIRIHTYRKIQ